MVEAVSVEFLRDLLLVLKANDKEKWEKKKINIFTSISAGRDKSDCKSDVIYEK